MIIIKELYSRTKVNHGTSFGAGILKARLLLSFKRQSDFDARQAAEAMIERHL